MQKTETEKFYPFSGNIQFLRISELPTEEREPFVAWLRGQCCPLPDGEVEGNCAYVHDYKSWVQRGRTNGLAEEIARQESAMKDNPDLPLQFIKDTLVGIEEAKQGQQSVYHLADKPMIIRKDEKYARILAIGDIHGCARHLQRLLDIVKPTREDLIVTLGDYVDRGYYSKDTIDILNDLHRNPEVNIVSLLGNHDALMLMCLDELQECKALYGMPGKVKCDTETMDMWWMVGAREPAPLWFGNQALATLSSYCDPGNSEQLERLQQVDGWVRWPKDYHEPLRDLLAEIIPPEHADFLKNTCVDACETDAFIFAHGGLCPDLPLADQPLFALHWSRFDKKLKPHVSGKKMVCGHTPQPDLLVHDLGHALCLDTGVYLARGFLTCMDILSGQCWQIDDNLQLIQQPVVHYDNRVPFIRISELPAEEQRQFMPCLMGRSIPFDGCAWPHDYREWWWGKR